MDPIPACYFVVLQAMLLVSGDPASERVLLNFYLWSLRLDVVLRVKVDLGQIMTIHYTELRVATP